MFHMDDVYDPPPHHLPIDEAAEVPVQGQIPLPVALIPVEQPQQPVALNPPHLIDAAAEEAAIDVPNGVAVEIPVEEEPLDPNPQHLIVAAVAEDIKDPEADLKAMNDANITQDSEAEMIKRLDANVVVERRRKRRRTTKSVQEMEISTYFEIKEEERRSMEVIAWEKLRASIVSYNEKVIGTKSASDSKQVFVRDFVPSAPAFLMNGLEQELNIVKDFLKTTLQLQNQPKKVKGMTFGGGLMPRSFRVKVPPKVEGIFGDNSDSMFSEGRDTLDPDFGGGENRRVASVDGSFWWMIVLWAYTKCTQDQTLVESPEMQRGIQLILNFCLSDGFDTFPALHCLDGCSMIDSRMGLNGYPLEIQSLFFALRCARQLLKSEDGGEELMEEIDRRIRTLSCHVKTYFWLDFNSIQQYLCEEKSHPAVKKFNIKAECVPNWVLEFMPLHGGYFGGSVSPGCVDFRWFLVGNCIAILSSLASTEQTTAIMDLFDERWEELIGEMPLKITYPALEGEEWKTVTGSDPMNTPWNYHNAGSWPVLLWLFTAACIKCGREATDGQEGHRPGGAATCQR